MNKSAEQSETVKEYFVCTGLYNPFPDFNRLNHRLKSLLKCEDDWDLEDFYRRRLLSISTPTSSNIPSSIETLIDEEDDSDDEFDDEYYEGTDIENNLIFDFD